MLSASATAEIAPVADRAQLEAQKAQLFQRMLSDPANLEVSFAYAKVSALLGDNEAAVGALERMLLFNPDLAAVDLELGALYFRMGAFKMARSYFDKALALNPPPEVKARVEQYLNEIALQVAPSRFTGLIFFGAQYQTDANVAPSAGLITSPIGPVLLSGNFVKKPDVDVFGAASVLYSYDLGTQNGDTLEIGGIGFVNHYFRFSRLDLDLVELNAGPRFRLPAAPEPIKSATVKPYLIVNNVTLGYDQYFRTIGGGIEGTMALPDGLAIKAAFEFRQKDFSNAVGRPLSTGLTGDDKLVVLALKKLVTPNSEVNFEFDYLDQSTRFLFYSNQTYALSGSYRVRYEDPTRTVPFPLETALYVGYLRGDYDAPDPCCNTSGSLGILKFSRRHDQRWRFGLSETVQILPNIALVAQFQRDIVSSNLSLYGYNSNSVVIGPQIRF